jgi:hypothetical protein
MLPKSYCLRDLDENWRSMSQPRISQELEGPVPAASAGRLLRGQGSQIAAAAELNFS